MNVARDLSDAWVKNQATANQAGAYLVEECRVDNHFVQGAADGLAMLTVLCHRLASRSGWWINKDGSAIDPFDPNVFAAKIALIHSEVSEALEGGRKDKADDHLPHRKGVEVELADTLIRIFDLAGAMRLDLAGAVVEKLAYNQRRADHKPENRYAEGGKKF
jgi:NTP pyrophosphatase (non-canonical NTP hydrolase)